MAARRSLKLAPAGRTVPSTSLRGKRVLITRAHEWMGPILREVFTAYGAVVISDSRSLIEPGAAATIVAAAGTIDILVANMTAPTRFTPAIKVSDVEWIEVFEAFVNPLPRLFRAVLPQMTQRRAGKVLLIGGFAETKDMQRSSAYGAAVVAQMGYVQYVGKEVAPHNVQVNAIVKGVLDDVSPLSRKVQAISRPKKHANPTLVPASSKMAREHAQFAAFLCSEGARCFAGQTFPL